MQFFCIMRAWTFANGPKILSCERKHSVIFLFSLWENTELRKKNHIRVIFNVIFLKRKSRILPKFAKFTKVSARKVKTKIKVERS